MILPSRLSNKRSQGNKNRGNKMLNKMLNKSRDRKNMEIIDRVWEDIKIIINQAKLRDNKKIKSLKLNL